MVLRDKQYDTVIHLISASLGAEQFYQTANNPTRSENMEEARHVAAHIYIYTYYCDYNYRAVVLMSHCHPSITRCVCRALDLRILNAWMGHPRLFIVDNSTDFKGTAEAS